MCVQREHQLTVTVRHLIVDGLLLPSRRVIRQCGKWCLSNGRRCRGHSTPINRSRRIWCSWHHRYIDIASIFGMYNIVQRNTIIIVDTLTFAARRRRWLLRFVILFLCGHIHVVVKLNGATSIGRWWAYGNSWFYTFKLEEIRCALVTISHNQPEYFLEY